MRLLLASLALVALGGLTACDPEEVLTTIQHTLNGDVDRTPGSGDFPTPVVDDPATPGIEGDESQPPIVDVVGPGLQFVPRPPVELPAGAVDPGNGDPIIYNPNTYTVCDVAGICTIYTAG